MSYFLYAQSIELTPFSGYTFPERFDVERGEVRISGGHTYGGILINIGDEYGIELLYSRQDAESDVTSFYLTDRDVPLSVNYIQAGGVRYFPLNDMTSLLGGVNLGAAGFVPKKMYEEAWRFVIGLKGGVKYFITDRIGLRVQANVQVPLLVFLWVPEAVE